VLEQRYEMAFWGLEVKPKKPMPLSIERRLVVKQAALVINKPSAEPCVLSVKVADGDQEYVVCRLHEGRLEHCTLELPFSPSDNATLHLKGPHTLHLTGFLDVDEEDNWDEMDDERAHSGPGMGDDDDDDDDDEDYGEDEDDEFDGEEEDDDEEDEDEEDEDEDELPAPPPAKKRPAPAAEPAAKKAKKAEAAAPPPAAASKSKGAAKASAPAPTPAAKSAAAAAPSDASPAGNPWSQAEETAFAKALSKYPAGSEGRWDNIAKAVGSRTPKQCKKKGSEKK